MKNELEKYYPFRTIEERLSKDWAEKKRFKPRTSKINKYFSMVVPPPNITGVLHIGHTLNATVQDILARQARVNQQTVCWVPGSDHASIATEAKVMAMLKETKNLDKKDITRDFFLQHAHQWKDKYGTIIYQQFQRLGCSMDWDKCTFTMDEHYYQSVVEVFVRLYNDGCIYQGKRMIHWDTIAQTALSDEEVEYRDVEATLYYIKYFSEDDPQQYLTIATKRPETIMGDVAVCVHPNDERYKEWIGKNVFVPLIHRAVPVISDERVDPTFGTGILKITPAHAVEDYHISLKHHLPIIETFNLDGTVSEKSPIASGETIAQAEKIVVALLRENQLIEKEERYQTRLGFSQRTNAVVEPFISTQWFVDTKKIAQPAIDVLRKGDIKFFPENRFENTYYHWMENIKDWCISRQLWWGHRIPAWYDEDKNVIVAINEEKAYVLYQKTYMPDKTVVELKSEKKLKQDEDCLDTWFSSWLWPIEVFRGMSQKENNDLIKSYYPTSVLVTGHDILFFWVARMVMAGLYVQNNIPFHHVYFTGMVRDHQGRKMSKSLGNSPDLLKLIDDYGADAVRFGVMIASPAGNDLLFDEASLTQGKNFINKIWNVWKLIWSLHDSQDEHNQQVSELEHFANHWMRAVIQKTQDELANDFAQYKLSEALKKIYTLIKDNFCNDYMEWIKPTSGQKISKTQMLVVFDLWKKCLQILHPFLPFATEDLFMRTLSTQQKSTIYIEDFASEWEAESLSSFDEYFQKGNAFVEIIVQVREAKQRHQIAQDTDWQLYFEKNKEDVVLTALLKKILRCPTVKFVEVFPDHLIKLAYQNWQYAMWFESDDKQQEEQIQKLKKDLEHQYALRSSIEKKLSNEKFMQNAKPELIEYEQKKLANTNERIAILEKNLS